MSDPWVITPAERNKHDEQFNSIGPSGGFITGEQAKNFFLQSRLPPQILGVIWMLSDMDGDGKMNQNEFSIACKLINMKLRGFNLPQTLPPSLKQSAIKAPLGGIPAAIPAAMPTAIPAAMPTAIPAAMPTAIPSSAMPTAIPSAIPPSLPSAMPAAMSSAMPPLVPTASLIGGPPPVASTGPPLIASSGQPPIASVGPMVTPFAPVASVAPIMATSVPVQQTVPVSSVSGMGNLMSGGAVPPLAPTASPVRPVVPTSVDASAVVAPPKVPIQDTRANADWGVPQASKLKFTQVFNMSDRAKTGFLSGAQARNILIQSALPQQILAQIWGLSDVDNDGRLSCEEFVLALYLCEQAKAGKPLPAVLPPDLIPPTLRRSRTSSIVSQGSIGNGSVGEAVISPTSAQLMTDTSFEDKRKENYEKGQAELERRRKALADAQRRENEERMRREREEEMKREKARQEAERKRQEELEREMQRQREIEALKEAERKRLEETKEQARKEAERQRQEEWEKQRLLELMNVRQRQQENLLALKAKNQTLTIDLSTKEEKIKELTQKISDTRIGVTEVKATIDNMRNTRDSYMTDMNNLKAQARDQNQRLLNLNQERARLKARSLASAAASGAETAAVEASVTSKQMVIKQLEEKVQELEKELESKEEDVNNNLTDFQASKEQLSLTGERCSTLYEEFSAKRKEVLALREKLLNPDAAWGDVGGSSWSDQTKSAVSAVPEGERKYRALYQFDARNDDELSFLPGDIILVVPAEGAEAGWLSGSLNGKIGWFPEAYCEPYYGELPESAFENKALAAVASVDEAMDDLASLPTAKTVADEATEGIAVFSWKASKGNQLSFLKGDKIILRERLEGWVYGELNGVGGWLPQSYVRGVNSSTVTTPQEAPEFSPIPQQLDHDEISQYYLSIYPYQSDEPGDLLFEVGEKILVLKKDGDWWFGIIKDRSGIFPSNYVQLAPDQLLSAEVKPEVEEVATEVKQQEEPVVEPIDKEIVPKESLASEEVVSEEGIEAKPEAKVVSSSVVSPPDSATLKVNQEDEAANKEVSELTKSPRSPKGKGKKLEVAQVIAPYDGTSANQLSLLRGQLVSIRKKTASGWWEGELHAKGKKRQIGWFPASYVKVMCGSSRTTPVSMEMTGRDDFAPSNFTPGDFANAFNKDAVKVEPKVNAPPPQDPETVEALYPYTAVNDDELTFEPGDLIFVLDKEDSAWWKGSLRGVIGVFPSNYVQPKSEAKVVTKQTPAAATVTSPDAEDSLCYPASEESRSPWNAWDKVSSNKAQNKRYTTYECFNSPDEVMRQNVIQEIIATESSYLKDLLLVQKAFIQPMKKSGIVTQKDLALIFINWDELVLVSSSFDKALKVRWKNSSGSGIHMISDILCQQISQLRPYMRFCSLQSKGSALLNEKFSEDKEWADVVRQCQQQPEVGGHSLTAFLLKPLQRLTKYPLLIDNLLTYTPVEHPDHQNTVDALQAATTLCEQVNEAARQQDNTDKLEWMQSHIHCENLMERLVFNSLTNTLGPRKLLHTGVLHKTKSKREIIAFLLSDFLLLTTASKPIGTPTSLLNFERALSDTNCTMYKKPLFLSEMSLRLEGDSETAFTISASGYEISLSASNSNERSSWLKAIALAQKHIKDTERSQLQRNRSKEKDSNIVGRVLMYVMGGVNLVSKEVRARPPKGLLKLNLLGANLEVWGKGTLHSFCEVSLGSQVHRTKVATSPHPKWDNAMQFFVKSLSEDVLCITVYEKGFFRPNEFLGRAEVRIQNIYETFGDRPGPHAMRLPLQEVKNGEVILKSSLQLFK